MEIMSNITWITEPLEMSLTDAMAAHLPTNTLVRTQNGMVWRKIYGHSSAFTHMTNRVTGLPLKSAMKFVKEIA